MLRVVIPLGLLLFASAPRPALAWGQDGHQIVCEIAWRELSRPTRARVRDLLSGDEETTFARSCSWADRVLRDRDESYDPYHYVNVPEGAAEIPACPGKCALSGIERFAAVLRDRNATKDERRFALKLVGHLVGDLHQPLHVGYAFDRGGNDVRVSFFGEPSNLHRVWDVLILERLHRDWKTYAKTLASQIRPIDRTLWTPTTPERLSTPKRSSTPKDWAHESYQLVEHLVYRELPSLDQAYLERARLVVEERLQAAGVRLAALLEETLSDPITTPHTAPDAPPSGSSDRRSSRSGDSAR